MSLFSIFFAEKRFRVFLSSILNMTTSEMNRKLSTFVCDLKYISHNVIPKTVSQYLRHCFPYVTGNLHVFSTCVHIPVNIIEIVKFLLNY